MDLSKAEPSSGFLRNHHLRRSRRRERRVAENAARAVAFGITFAGTYTVNPDCTGSLTFTDNRGRTGHRAVAIVQDGREIGYTFTDRGIPGVGVAKQQ